MKKFICCFLVALMLFINCSVSSFAVEEDKGIPIPYTLSGRVDYDSVSVPKLSGNAPTYYYLFDNGKPDWNSYSLLDDCQKKIFDSIANAPVGTLTFTINFETGEFLYSNFLNEYFMEVMYALCNDRPDLFYYAGYSIDGYLYDNDYVKQIIYSVLFYENTSYPTADLSEYHSDLIDAVKAVPVDTSNRYNFVKTLHDFLCETILYPDLTTSLYTHNAHDAYGALVENIAVCQGYADAFKLVCDYYKIPCVCVSGTANGGGHMWNAVQMDDGLWYFIDATWDDQTDEDIAGIFYDFFLVGTNTNDIYFGGDKFSQSHIKDDSMLLPTLKFASEKYVQDNHFTGFKATYNSYTIDTDKILVRSFFDANDSYVYFNGMYVEVPTPATTSTVTVPSGTDGAEENWILSLIGDCDGDADADLSDYSIAVNKVLAGTDVATVYDFAADASCDGYLDVLDLAILERAITGKNTDIIIE